ncbi:MAG: hypothetical protein IJ062_03545 [Firmicutes bacterium]|nr:hypothetical protein [Bacillota bacterium]
MKKTVNSVSINGYTCYKKLDNINNDNVYINNKLAFLSSTISQIHYSTGKNLVKCNIYAFESKEINAFAAKYLDGEYAIALSSELFLGLNIELESYLINKDIRKYFYGKKINIKKHIEKIIDYILLFVVLHENYHILNGHCDTYYSQGKSITEHLANGKA